MREPHILAWTGLSVREHQARTVASYLELRALAPHLPFIPVVRRYHLADYLACVDLYRSAGVDLTRQPLTGLGSVCRRQSTGQIAVIVTLASPGLRLHGFGIKTTGLHLYGHPLACSYRPERAGARWICRRCRREGSIPLPGPAGPSPPRGSQRAAIKPSRVIKPRHT